MSFDISWIPAHPILPTGILNLIFSSDNFCKEVFVPPYKNVTIYFHLTFNDAERLPLSQFFDRSKKLNLLHWKNAIIGGWLQLWSLFGLSSQLSSLDWFMSFYFVLHNYKSLEACFYNDSSSPMSKFNVVWYIYLSDICFQLVSE